MSHSISEPRCQVSEEVVLDSHRIATFCWLDRKHASLSNKHGFLFFVYSRMTKQRIYVMSGICELTRRFWRLFPNQRSAGTCFLNVPRRSRNSSNVNTQIFWIQNEEFNESSHRFTSKRPYSLIEHKILSLKCSFQVTIQFFNLKREAY